MLRGHPACQLHSGRPPGSVTGSPEVLGLKLCCLGAGPSPPTLSSDKSLHLRLSIPTDSTAVPRPPGCRRHECAPIASRSPYGSHRWLASQSKLQKAPTDCPAQARSKVSEPGFPVHTPGSLPDARMPSLPLQDAAARPLLHIPRLHPPWFPQSKDQLPASREGRSLTVPEKLGVRMSPRHTPTDQTRTHRHSAQTPHAALCLRHHSRHDRGGSHNCGIWIITHSCRAYRFPCRIQMMCC